MQAVPLPQKNTRESNKSCFITSTGVTHAFQLTRAISEPSQAAISLKAPSVSKKDAVQSLKENSLVLTPSNQCSLRVSRMLQNTTLATSHHRVGHPFFTRALATSGTTTKSMLKDEDLLHSPPKNLLDEPSLSLFERAYSYPSIMPVDRARSNSKSESYNCSLDANLTLGPNSLQIPGSKERASGDLSLMWEFGDGNDDQSRLSCSPSTSHEATVGFESPSGKDLHTQRVTLKMGRDRGWKGKHQDGKPQDGKVDTNAEHVQERNVVHSTEHCAKPITNPYNDRIKKRVRRETIYAGVTFTDPREQTCEIEEIQDCKNSGVFENHHQNLRRTWNGQTYSLPQMSSEKASDKVFAEVLNGPSDEQKSVVVKQTPKRVPKSGPSSIFAESEVLMLDGSVRSSRSMAYHLSSPLNKPGVNNVMHVGDLASTMIQQRGCISQNLVCGRVTAVDYNRSSQNGCKAQQSQLESRPDTSSASSLMSTSKHSLSMGEPSLSSLLNFSPKPYRPVVPVSRTSTDEEWGKSLALFGPGAETANDVECIALEPKPMSSQDRFVQLQLFLKKCDEDDQSYLLDALRQLSATARSSLAVELEQKALWLSIEEGKEITRLRSLNVMGQRNNHNDQCEVGCTPLGLRAPSSSLL